MSRHKRILAVVVTAVCLVSFASFAQAEILAIYPFGDTEELSSTDSNTDSTAADFVIVGAPGRSGGQDDLYLATSATGSTEVAALADTDYRTFTVTANSGMLLNLSTLTFDFGYYTSASAISCSTYVQSSVDGLGTGGDVLGTYTMSSPSTGRDSDPFSTDLSAAKFQGLSAITFRFSYSDNLSEAAHISSDRLDNVVLNGSAIAAVPEPSTLALLLFGGFGLLIARRWRR